MSSPAKRLSGSVRRKASQERSDRILRRFESVEQLRQEAEEQEEESRDLMEAKSVGEFFRRGAGKAGVGSFWARAALANSSSADASANSSEPSMRKRIPPGIAVEAHLASLAADGAISPDADALMAEVDAALRQPSMSESVAEDPLLAPDVGFIQRHSPLTRRLSALATALPIDGKPAKQKSPAMGRLQRGATATIVKRDHSGGARKSPRLMGVFVPSPHDGNGGGRSTPGLATKTPKSSGKQSRLASKTKRWMSALESLGSTLRTSKGEHSAPPPADALDALVASSCGGPSAPAHHAPFAPPSEPPSARPSGLPSRRTSNTSVSSAAAILTGPGAPSQPYLGHDTSEAFAARFAKPMSHPASKRASPRRRGSAVAEERRYLTGLSSSV